MCAEPRHSIVDLSEWSRGNLFKYYIDHMRVVMSLTVDIDVAPLIRYGKRNGLKFYPTMLWLVSKAVNDHNEFKYGWDESGNLIKWDYISPSYTDFHQENESFIKIVTEYSDNLTVFHRRFLSDRERFRMQNGIIEDRPPNFFDVSCLPWVKYKHFDFHVFEEGKFLAPVITWGKYEATGEQIMMPLTMNIHHAVADGFHLSRFFLEVQKLINLLNAM